MAEGYKIAVSLECFNVVGQTDTSAWEKPALYISYPKDGAVKAVGMLHANRVQYQVTELKLVHWLKQICV
jgi:hypothetical protein